MAADVTIPARRHKRDPTRPAGWIAAERLIQRIASSAALKQEEFYSSRIR